MKHWLAVAVVLAAVGSSRAGFAQSPQPVRRLVGNSVGAQLFYDPATRTTTDTVTLTFKTSGDEPAVTVDFVARYATAQLSSAAGRAPEVVDMIVTERPAEDEQPQMQMRVDGQPFPLNGRLRSRRAIVATMPFADFIRLTSAERIVEQSLNAELEFGPSQMRMLQTTAAKWSGR